MPNAPRQTHTCRSSQALQQSNRDLQCSGTEWVMLSSQPNNGISQIPLSFISNSAESYTAHTHTDAVAAGVKSLLQNKPALLDTLSQSLILLIESQNAILKAEGSDMPVLCSPCTLSTVKWRPCLTLHWVKWHPVLKSTGLCLDFTVDCSHHDKYTQHSTSAMHARNTPPTHTHTETGTPWENEVE